MRSLLIKFLNLSGDQRSLSKENLTSDFLRPFENRRSFDLHKAFIPSNIPFEVYCFYRFFYKEKFEGMTHMQYHDEHMFKFDEEFIFQQLDFDGRKMQF